MELTKFCNTCRGLLSCQWVKDEGRSTEERTWYRSFDRQTEPKPMKFYSVSELRQWSDRQCQLCQLVNSSFGFYAGFHEDASDHVSCEPALSVDSPSQIILWASYPHGSANIDLSPSPCVPDITVSPKVSTGSGTFDSREAKLISSIHSWLQDCQCNHESCGQWVAYGQRSLSVAQLPARLLFLGNTGNEVKLVDTAALSSDIRYITLSHRWGGSVPNQLTNESLVGLYTGISYLDLPPVFRDAVLIARKLSVRYVWIDAMCIKQDSKEDWRKEASKMAGIYSQSYVNLAATASIDSNSGLRCQNPTFDESYHTVITQWRELGLGSVRLEPHWNWYNFVDKAPLNSRGWVYQERALSPRIVHFAHDKIWWQCCHLVGHEIQTERVQFDEYTDPNFLIIEGKWNTLVKRYSGTQLTKDCDYLVAFAGIARLYGRIHGYADLEYLTGIWKGEELESLAWCVLERKPTCSLRLPGIPTWSWASIKTKIQFLDNGDPDDYICELKKVDLLQVDGDPFTTSTVSSLHIEGTLFKVRTEARSIALARDRHALHYRIGQTWFLVVNEAVDSEHDAEAMRASEQCLDRVAVYPDLESDEDSDEDSDDQWLLPLWSGCFPSYLICLHERDMDVFGDMTVVGLLVRPAGNRAGAFRRVGIIVAYQDKTRWNAESWTSCSLDSGLYTEDLHNGRYRFELV